ncbi:MAG TPA: hypothetical protein DDX72_00060 [Ruminococcaceae bacterium]|nr:hypothetical protein [Oscillospiraceae bacterium]
MKHILKLLLLTVISAVILCGCESLPDADFESPDAVIDATLANNPIQEGEINGMYDDLAGKTLLVKTNSKKENDIAVLYTGTYGTNSVSVFIGGLYDDSGKPLTNFDYNKGDYVVVKIDFVSFRGTKDGKLREYFIFTGLNN